MDGWVGDLGITLLGLNMSIIDLLWSREIGIVSGSRLESASNLHFSEDKKTDDTLISTRLDDLLKQEINFNIEQISKG